MVTLPVGIPPPGATAAVVKLTVACLTHNGRIGSAGDDRRRRLRPVHGMRFVD
ncbi:MAG: hypothetical protein MZV70_01070 [Desulfobacterales bacterium]|nr:hypothetical protein [Desulfobacterales bacterium]